VKLYNLWHLNYMKQLLTLCLFLIVCKASAQDTLYLPVPGLGHEKYILNDNRTFIYNSDLCGSSFVSLGTYRKNLTGYKFKYDSTQCPTPSITAVNQDLMNDSILLLFHNMVDSTRQQFFGSLILNEQRFAFDSDSIIIPKQASKSNVLILNDYLNKLTFTLDSTSTTFNVYLEPFGNSYRCGPNDIRRLKKRRNGYLHKFNVYDEIRGEPWKKGTKRVVRHYYQLRE
jgi:hypothetical protein